MNLRIIPYQADHHTAFRNLNILWLEQYHLKESHDVMVLDDPDGTILKQGGSVWIAIDDENVIGSAALMKEHDGVYELAKMCVAESYRGKGISRLLIEKCIQQAKEVGAKKVFLFSNHQLQAAIALYEKYGFKHIAVENSPFETADIKMELVF
jgi:putative acetyltransferase